ncbi:MAG: acyl carrier protein [Firmicutes bacterium]|nr:acyl carrier protein [Bacillota bacterium]
METFNKIANLIAQNRGIDASTIKNETTFDTDLKIDSLDMMDMIMQISEEFNIATDDIKPGEIKSVGDLVKFVDAQGK